MAQKKKAEVEHSSTSVEELAENVAELSRIVSQLSATITQLQETLVRKDTRITNLENNRHRDANRDGGNIRNQRDQPAVNFD